MGREDHFDRPIPFKAKRSARYRVFPPAETVSVLMPDLCLKLEQTFSS